ncbi:MAG: hypothetical protein OXR82_10235 [Gammaproteobacteria bacterium]|nr:hypothetical protein [Gammaproteobacteria bacterium]MDE0258745.1 hypothetical protein [Gammaproteobacteria bacterium]
MAGLLLELPAEDAQLAAALVARQLLPVALGDQRPVVVELRHVQFAEAVDDASVGRPVEPGQRLLLAERRIQPGGVAGVVEEAGELARRVRA